MVKESGIGAKLVQSMTFVLVLTMLAGILWNIYTQKRQARIELLEQSRILAKEVLAMRQVVAENQHKINYDKKGNFEFKHLNPAAITQLVNDSFNKTTDYKIRQIRLQPRLKENTPDAFEKEKLLFFEKNKAVKESWGITNINGKNYFKYLIPLKVDPSCLNCHGGPKGELDVSGNKKEGYELGGLAGALSISIPMATKEASLYKNISQNMMLMAIAVLFSGGVIFFYTRKFVVKPIGGLIKYTEALGSGHLSKRPDDFGAYGEINQLTGRFSEMAARLQEMYEELEKKVDERTAELAAANRELEQISQYKSEFLANMSHELRTPLTAILAFSQELMKKSVGQLTGQQEEYLRDIRDSGEQLLGLINNLLDLSKIESNKMHLRLYEMQIGPIAGEVAKLLSPLAEQKKVHLKIKIHDQAAVIADADKVRQVVQNLLSNAIKFTPADGTVELRVFNSNEPEEGTMLVVRDTGHGITDDEQERIFDAFYQSDRGLNKEFPGTGLGLALVKKIVDLHMGQIYLESKMGEGSVFTVFWPAYPSIDHSLE